MSNTQLLSRYLIRSVSISNTECLDIQYGVSRYPIRSVSISNTEYISRYLDIDYLARHFLLPGPWEPRA
jgi:hypothetical protein